MNSYQTLTLWAMLSPSELEQTQPMGREAIMISELTAIKDAWMWFKYNVALTAD
jgi:hypothetical protein